MEGEGSEFKPREDNEFSFLHFDLTGSGTHSASYPVRNESYYLEVKAVEASS
jgi:hypothetical protein